MADVNAKVDINKFYEVARRDVASLVGGLSVNASGAAVTFFVYNYIDTVYWISAAKVLVADGYYGSVVASGKFFKIHPNDNKSEEFLVAPHTAYIYSGPGKLEKV